MRLANQYILLIGVLLLFLSVAATLFHHKTLDEELTLRQQEWARTLAGAVAEVLARDIINGNTLNVTQTLQTIVNSNEELEYAFATDFDGKVAAHTFDGGFPSVVVAVLGGAPDTTTPSIITTPASIT